MKRSPDFSVMIGALTILVGIAGMMWLYCRLDCSDLAIQFLLCLVAVGTALWAAPRTDPYVQNYRIRLLPRVSGVEATFGYGCRIWAWESSDRRAAEPLPVMRCRWLRRRSAQLAARTA